MCRYLECSGSPWAHVLDFNLAQARLPSKYMGPIWATHMGSATGFRMGSHIGVFVDLILYVQSTIFQLYRDESSWI